MAGCSHLALHRMHTPAVYVMTTHCGSRFADTVEKIQQLQPNATVVRGVAVSGFDPGSSETEVREYVRSTIK